jgi:hypothetical protein
VSRGEDGELDYSVDSNGNQLPDFSYAGYKLGDAPIPQKFVLKATVTPVAGDNTANIQAALDTVGAMTVDSDGFRGMVLLKAGTYEIASPLLMNKNGVVLRGEGAGLEGTIIKHTGTDQESSIKISPSSGGIGLAKVTDITSDYIAVGDREIEVDSLTGLSVGQTIFIECHHTQQWIDELSLAAYWSLGSRDIKWERVITALDPSTLTITLDAPLTSIVDIAGGYAVAEIQEVTDDYRVSQVGIEDILFVSDYDRTQIQSGSAYYNDENHADRAIEFIQAKDSWVQRCVGFFYRFAFVSTWRNSSRITIQDCAMFDGVSTDTPTNHTGTREYYFNMDGDNILVQRCYGRGGRHTFITNGSLATNKTFLHCYADSEHLSSEPHQGWTTAVLYDNVYTDGQFKLEGTGTYVHGQKAANSALWNCISNNKRVWEPAIYLNSPKSGLGTNWVVGCMLNGGSTDPAIENVNNYGDAGFVESSDVPVEIRSLFMAQARDRRGEAALYETSTNAQFISREAVFNDMIDKYDSVASFGDPDDLSWLPSVNTYAPTIADQAYLSLLDEEESIAIWSNTIEVSSPVSIGNVSAYWDGANEDAYNFAEIESVPSDLSGYDSLRFSMYSAVANDAVFAIIMGSEDPSITGGDYYRYNVTVDWTGWKDITVPLIDFIAVRNPVGWEKIDSLLFANKGFDAVIEPDTELYIDALSFEDSTQIVLLDESDLIGEWTFAEASTAHSISGTVSAYWTEANLDEYRHMTLDSGSGSFDFSEFSELHFWMHSAVANSANFAIVASSEDPNSSGGDYYRYNIDVDWTGWQEFVIPFSSFISVRSPVGWDQIDSITFSNKGFSAVVEPDTELYLDQLTVEE